MDMNKILSACDHTLLRQDATWADIQTLCDDAVKYHTASVCIPPCYVRPARDYAGKALTICTVIGFPNGNMTTAAKIAETRDAIQDGADEIDMVINIGWVKDKKYEAVLDEIKSIREVCAGHILKVIIEACLLNEEEKIRMCEVVTASGADYIKTSTGFSTGGATFKDVELFAAHIGSNVRIKAAGGISSLEDAERFLSLGASRLGTSRIVKIAKEAEQ